MAALNEIPHADGIIKMKQACAAVLLTLVLTVVPAVAQTTTEEFKQCADQGGCVTMTRDSRDKKSTRSVKSPSL